jgi:uncharacterized protein (TIGR03083 family)
MLSHTQYLAHLDADAHLLAAAAAKGFGRDVPCCPGWSVTDLVDHVSKVYASRTDIVERGLVDSWPPRRPRPADVDSLEWFRAEATRLSAALAAADPSGPAITFSHDRTVGFWIRRMAHETLVHRIDAEQAHGYESLVDPELAVDGIAELFEVFVTRFPDWGEFVPGDDVVRVDAGDRVWTVRLGRFVGTNGDRAHDLPKGVAADESPPAVTISGAPDRVLLWMWGRAPLDDVTVHGDADLALRFREVCTV